MRLPLCCRKKEPPEPIYELTDPRHYMQQMDKGFGPKTAIETCQLLLQFPLAWRRTKTSPIKLRLENTALNERLLILLTRIANDTARKDNVKKHAFSFWSSFKSGDRPFPVTSDVERNKLETWLHQHNYIYPKKRRGKINEFCYLIDPKATLKHLNIVKDLKPIHKIMEYILERGLWADSEEKRIQKEKEAAEAAEDSESDSDEDDDDDSNDGSINSDDSNESRSGPPSPEDIYQDALDELEDDLDNAIEQSSKQHDEWGNKLPDSERKQRAKICEVIKRKIDKVRVKMAGAKFDVYNKCIKSLDKVKRRFERQMGEVIKIAEARRMSRMRAKQRLQLFDEEQEWYQHGSRYDDAPSSKPKAMRWNIQLKPISEQFDRPWIKGTASSHGWRRRALALVSKPFWKQKPKLSMKAQLKMELDEKRNTKKYNLTDKKSDLATDDINIDLGLK